MADISGQPEIFNPATATNRQIIEYYSSFARYLVNNSIIKIDEGFLQQINDPSVSDDYLNLNYYYFHILSELLVHYSGGDLPVNVRLGYWLALLGMHKKSQVMFGLNSGPNNEEYFNDDNSLILETMITALTEFINKEEYYPPRNNWIRITPAKLAKLYCGDPKFRFASFYGSYNSTYGARDNIYGASNLEKAEEALRKLCHGTALLTEVSRSRKRHGKIDLPEWLVYELNVLLINNEGRPSRSVLGFDEETRFVWIRLEKEGMPGSVFATFVPPKPSYDGKIASMTYERIMRQAERRNELLGGPSSYPTR